MKSLHNIILLFSLSFCLVAMQGCKRASGFALQKIQSKYFYNPDWDIPSEIDPTELNAIFNQSFHYLASGNHCYAFTSNDGKYVMKFFKQKHMDTMRWRDRFLPFRKAKMSHREQMRKQAFTSYKIAYEELKEETGLLFLHLSRTSHLKKRGILIDQHGKRHVIDFDNMEFLIQKKAKVGYQYIEELIEKGNDKEAIDAIDSLLRLPINRAKKGIFDKDMQIFKNFGFIDHSPIEIDIGEFKKDLRFKKSEMIQKEVEKFAWQIREWITTHYPRLSSMVEKKIEETLQELKNE